MKAVWYTAYPTKVVNAATLAIFAGDLDTRPRSTGEAPLLNQWTSKPYAVRGTLANVEHSNSVEKWAKQERGKSEIQS